MNGNEPEVKRGPLFCDVEQVRQFTDAEIEWRSEHAPTNLRLDLKTNATGKRECGWKNL